MVLRRKRPQSSAVVVAPAEFFEPDHPAWRSVGSVTEWFAAQGLELPAGALVGQFMQTGPMCRRARAIEAWLLGNGFASERWPSRLDPHRLSELELPAGYMRDQMRERISSLTKRKEK